VNGDAGPSPGATVAIESFVAEVVRRATRDDSAGLHAILPVVYDELRGLAACLLRGERAGHTLRPTALAHEAYLRLARETRSGLRSREELLGVAATAMRRVLVDYARARGAAKRGAGAQRITLVDNIAAAPGTEIDLLDLHRALERLGEVDSRKVRVVELLYFAGLTHEEAGNALGVSAQTVLRDWRFAKAWLWRELGVGGAEGQSAEEAAGGAARRAAGEDAEREV